MLTKQNLLTQIEDTSSKFETLEAKVSGMSDSLDSLNYVLACICRSKGLEPNDKMPGDRVLNLSIDSEYVAALVAENGEDGLIELLDIG